MIKPTVFAAFLAVTLAAPLVSHAAPKSGKAAAAQKAFDAQPAVGTKAVCAVSGEEFMVTKKTAFATYKGKTYAFCCPDCKPQFEKDPAKYSAK